MVQSRTACHRHFQSIQAARGGLLHLARFQHQCAGPEGSSHARALSRLGLGSDLRHRRQWRRLDRAPLYGTAASEAADSWCPVKTARQISKLFPPLTTPIKIEQPKGRTDKRDQFILARPVGFAAIN